MPKIRIRDVVGTDGKTNPNYQTFEYDNTLEQTSIFGLVDDSDQYMTIDATINTRHDASVRITQHPVEIGANISDFAIVEPRTFTLTGRISMIKPLRNNGTEDPDDILSGAVNRVAEAWDALEDAMRNRRELSIYTNLKAYDSILIRDLSANQDWRTARVLDFTANLQEIIKAAVNETQLTKDQLQEGSAQEQAAPTAERGDIQAQDITDISELGAS
jgi:hypothetical protein